MLEWAGYSVLQIHLALVIASHPCVLKGKETTQEKEMKKYNFKKTARLTQISLEVASPALVQWIGS